jgi:hypothetical protein
MFPGFRFGLFRDYVFCSSMRVSLFAICQDVACCHFCKKEVIPFFFLKKELFPASKEVILVTR